MLLLFREASAILNHHIESQSRCSWPPVRLGIKEFTMRKTSKIAFLVASAILLIAGTAYSQNFWQPIPSQVPGGYVGAIAFQEGGRILVGGLDSSVFVTTDGGSTWTRLGYLHNVPFDGSALSLVTYPNGRIVAAAGRPEATWTYLSTDNGASWQITSASIDSMTGLVKGKSDGWIYGFGTSGMYSLYHIYYSSDDGASWNIAATAGYSVCSMCVDSNNEIYAGTLDGYVVRSTDHGETWSTVGAQLGKGPVTNLAAGANNDIYAGSADTAFYVFDGSSWHRSAVFAYAGDWTSMTVNSLGAVFVGTTLGGVYRTTDLGVSWVQLTSGLAGNPINTLAIDSAGYLFAGTRSNYGVPNVYRSVNTTTPPVPGAPSLVLPLNSSTNVRIKADLSWLPVPFADSYRLQMATDTGFAAIAFDTMTNSDSVTVSLRSAVRYYWHVYSMNVAGRSSFSPMWSFVTLITPPANLVAAPANKSVNLNWTSSTGAHVARYRIYRGTSQSTTPLYDSSLTTSFIDSGLTNGTMYYYKVTAVDSLYGESGFSNEVSSSPFNKPPVAAPLSNVNLLNTARNLTSSVTFSSSGSTDPDGSIDSTIWLVNDRRVGDQPSLTYSFGPGTSRVTLVVVDNQGASDSSVAHVNRAAFVKPLGGQVASGLSMVGDNVLYASASGDGVYRLDSNETTVYKLQVAGSNGSSCSIAYDSTVYIPSSDNNLYAFSKNATSVWSALPLGGSTSATPTVDSTMQRIYIGVSNDNFLGVNRLTGAVVWNFFTNSPISNSAVISSDRRLVFPTDDGTVYGVDLDASSNPTAPTWTLSLPGTDPTSPAIDQYGDFYFGTSNGNLYGVSMKRGEPASQLWNIHLGGKLLAAPVIDANGILYIGSTDSTLYAVNLSSKSVVWKLKTNGAIRYTAAISPAGNIYFDNDSGDLYSVDNTGKVVWSFYDPGDGLQVIGPILYNNGMVYAGAGAKSVISLYDGNGTESSASRLLTVTNPIWGTFQGNNQRTGIQPIKIVSSVSDPKDKIPTSFALYQNYPNPFNPSTLISYDIPRSSYVTLKIYDVLGRRVADLVNGERKPGRYQALFNASDLPSGVYFYRFEAGAYHDTKKLLLLK